MQMPMYGSPMGYNQPYGGWQAPQQLYQPQANSFMPKAQNAADGLNQGYGSMPWIFVSSEEDARNRIVQPNQTAWFMDNNNPYFYVKSCDVSGAVTFKKFKFSEDSGMMSPADIAALTRGNTGFGGDGISWLVLILLFFGFMGGGWGGRYGNGELGQYATAAS